MSNAITHKKKKGRKKHFPTFPFHRKHLILPAQTPVTMQMFRKSLAASERNSLGGALGDAGTAFNAVTFSDLSLTISNFNSSHGAAVHTGLASAALFGINFGSHFSSPIFKDF